MKTRLSRKFIAMFFTLCMVLSFVSIPTFATDPTQIDRVDFIHEIPSYHAGESPKKLAKITDSDAHYTIYDEYLEEVKDKPGETNTVIPTGNYWHSNPIAMANVDPDKKITTLEAGKKYLYYIVFQPENSNYKFSEDTAVYKDSYKLGTPQTYSHYLDLVDSSFRLQYLYMASVSVSGNSEEQTITDVSVVNINTNLDASKPVTFTASADTSCTDKFDVTEETWEAANPLNDIIKSTDASLNAPKAGGEYWYSIELTAKDGYVLSKDFSDCLHIKDGSGVTFTVDGVPYSGNIAVSDDGKTFTAWEFMDPVTITENNAILTTAVVENAKFDYQPGDIPQVTARVSKTDTDKYEIEYECWQQFENNNPVAAWYSDNGSHGSLPTITKFESGKSYVYSIMLKPKDGYSFSDKTVITVNEQKVSAPFVGGSMYIPSIKTITMPTVTAVSDYKVIEGANSSWIQNADKTLTFRVDGDLSKFVGIKVDDEWVDKENYTVASGSTIVTLKNEYLKTLSEGEHKITFVYTDGEVSTNFEVNETEKIYENSNNPKTGDTSNILVWYSLFATSVLSMLGIIVYNKKKKSIV